MSGKKRPRQKEKIDDDADDSDRWECTVCTFRNRFEAFKCEMCDTRKGTSTRKPRLNQDLQQMHTAVHNHVLQQHQKLPNVFPHGRRSAKHLAGMISAGSPSTSRQSPESTSSGSVHKERVASTNVKKRKPVPLADNLIYRTSPKKSSITVRGITATITEFRPRPVKQD